MYSVLQHRKDLDLARPGFPGKCPGEHLQNFTTIIIPGTFPSRSSSRPTHPGTFLGTIPPCPEPPACLTTTNFSRGLVKTKSLHLSYALKHCQHLRGSTLWSFQHHNKWLRMSQQCSLSSIHVLYFYSMQHKFALHLFHENVHTKSILPLKYPS